MMGWPKPDDGLTKDQRYDRSAKGKARHRRYQGTAKAMIRAMRYEAKRRGNR